MVPPRILAMHTQTLHTVYILRIYYIHLDLYGAINIIYTLFLLHILCIEQSYKVINVLLFNPLQCLLVIADKYTEKCTHANSNRSNCNCKAQGQQVLQQTWGWSLWLEWGSDQVKAWIVLIQQSHRRKEEIRSASLTKWEISSTVVTSQIFVAAEIKIKLKYPNCFLGWGCRMTLTLAMCVY